MLLDQLDFQERIVMAQKDKSDSEQAGQQLPCSPPLLECLSVAVLGAFLSELDHSFYTHHVCIGFRTRVWMCFCIVSMTYRSIRRSFIQILDSNMTKSALPRLPNAKAAFSKC